MRDKVYKFFYRISIKKYTSNDLQLLILDNIQKINKLPSNSPLKHTLILQNRVIKDLLQKRSYRGKGK